MVEDKKSHKKLGLYIGMELAEKFLEFQRKERLLESAKKIRENSKQESEIFEMVIDDGI
jgi:hypothetical protein